VPASLGAPGAPPATEANLETADLGWRDFFTDERLKQLIALSLEHNRDLKMAVLAVAETRAAYQVQNSERWPMLEISGSAAHRGGFERSSTKSYEAGLGLTLFDLDFFGRLKNMSEAAWQQYLATAEAARQVKIALISQVAQSYLVERLAREELTLAQSSLASWSTSFAFIERLLAAGQATLLDLEQARGMIEFARVEAARREIEVTRAVNALNILLGAYEPLALPPAPPLLSQTLATLPAQVMSTSLLRRPDVAGAERQLLAANADIGAARAAFFPSLSLTSDLGYMSENLGRLFTGANSAWSFIPRLSAPVFTGGRNRSNLKLAEIRKDQAIVQYEMTIEAAFREVADALLAREAFHRQFQAQQKYLSSQRLVLDLATAQYASGAVSYLEVLDAQRNVFQAEQDLLAIKQEQLSNDINLYTALGGGLNERGQNP
jgi:Cu(I)/Ag(I) efflux system outer membrane protein